MNHRCTLKLIDCKESDTISLQKQMTDRQNKEMEFHFFVCSFCPVGQGAKTNKRENEISKYSFPLYISKRLG